MNVEERFKTMASLIGEPARATMLWCLLDGRALTATELAIRADVSAQSASMHLNKLMQAGILTVESQGRHRYYRFAQPETAYVIEALANLAIPQHVKPGATPEPATTDGIRYCRTCYDHLAGKVAVEITNRLVREKILIAGPQQYDITRKGMQWFQGLGINVELLKQERRQLSRRCLDWSERKPHLAGALGAALLTTWTDRQWITRHKSSRLATLTPRGQEGLYKLLGLNL